jgi:hypothetical protein
MERNLGARPSSSVWDGGARPALPVPPPLPLVEEESSFWLKYEWYMAIVKSK